MNTRHFALLALALAILPGAGLLLGKDTSQAARWSWQQAYAEVDPRGDLTWKPRPFAFEPGNSVRYIDLEAGERFEHVFFPIRIRSLLAGQRVDEVRIEDNEFRYTDDGILSVADGGAWGYADLRGRLGDVRICRNHSFETGRRPARYSNGTGIEVAGARTLEIAGNVVERTYAQGIDVHGAKRNGVWG